MNLFLWILLLAVMPFARFLSGQPLLAGTIPYYNLRVSAQFWTNGLTDSAISGGRLFIPTPYQALLSLFDKIFEPPIAMILFTGAVQLLSFVILDKIFQEVIFIRHLRKYFMFLYGISLPVLGGMLSPSPAAFSLSLALVGIYALMKEKNILSSILLFILSFQGMFETFLAVAILIFLFREKNKDPSSCFLALVFILLAFNVPLYFFSRAPLQDASSFVGEFGGKLSFSISALLLAFIGVLFVWRYKTKQYFPYFFFMLLLAYSFFDKSIIPYANIFVVFLSAHSLYVLVNLKFVLRALKPLFLFFVFSGLLVQPIFFIAEAADAMPDNTILEVLAAGDKKIVLSEKDTGFLVEYLGSMALLDGIKTGYFHTPRREELSEKAFNAVEAGELNALANKLGATHILLTPDLSRKHPRFAELLTNSENFKSVIHKNEYALYAVKK